MGVPKQRESIPLEYHSPQNVGLVARTLLRGRQCMGAVRRWIRVIILAAIVLAVGLIWLERTILARQWRSNHAPWFKLFSHPEGLQLSFGADSCMPDSSPSGTSVDFKVDTWRLNSVERDTPIQARAAQNAGSFEASQMGVMIPAEQAEIISHSGKPAALQCRVHIIVHQPSRLRLWSYTIQFDKDMVTTLPLPPPDRS